MFFSDFGDGGGGGNDISLIAPSRKLRRVYKLAPRVTPGKFASGNYATGDYQCYTGLAARGINASNHGTGGPGPERRRIHAE